MTASFVRRPFLAFVALAIGFAVAFAVWSAVVLTGTAIPEFDREVSETFTEHGSAYPVTRWLMIVATSCGGVRANFFIAACGAFWMWRHHRRRFAVAWLLIAIVGGLMILEFKSVFDRDRPPREMRDVFVTQENASYPSGHAMGSLVGYGMLGFVVGQRVKGWRRIGLAALLSLWVILIGFSRVYLRAHWVSDIVGGWLLGAAYVNACLAVYFHHNAANATASRAA